MKMREQNTSYFNNSLVYIWTQHKVKYSSLTCIITFVLTRYEINLQAIVITEIQRYLKANNFYHIYVKHILYHIVFIIV
jgi:hypothetical protein